MNIFLVDWGHHERRVADIAKDLENRGHNIVYWIRSNRRFRVDESFYPRTILQDWDAAAAAMLPPELENKKLLVPEKELLHKLRRTELVALAMLDRDFPKHSVMQKQEMYHQHFQLWWSVLHILSVDVVIMPNIPHRIFDHLIYALAQYLKIPIILFGYTSIKDRLYVMHDYEKGFLDKFDNISKNNTLQNLSPDILEYYHNQTNQAVDNTPLYTKDQWAISVGLGLLKRKLSSLPKAIKHMNLHRVIWKNLIEFLANLGVIVSLKKEYQKLMIKPVYDVDYIYVPLHFQPECTTLPQGDVYIDQILMIETLASSLPAGWRLYVKEHIAQWFVFGIRPSEVRAADYYKRLAKIPNVYLIPVEENSFKLSQFAKAVATVTGTAGWEAILRKVPALVFGYPWYMDAPGVFKISGPKDCINFFNILNNGYKITTQEMVEYLAFLDKNTFHARLQAYHKKVSNLTDESNHDVILQIVLSELDKIKNK